MCIRDSRQRQAEEGIKELAAVVDTLITIRNDRLIQVAGESTSMLDSFRRVDDVLFHAVKGISDVINVHGLINVDFADVKTIMSNQGMALMGSGIATGPNRALEAANAAIHSPLLDNVDISGAMGILINITGGSNLTLHEVNVASSAIADAAHEDANIIFGSVIDEAYTDQVKITVIATGFDGARQSKARSNSPSRSTEGAVSGSWTVPAQAAPMYRQENVDIPTHIRNRWESQQREPRRDHPVSHVSARPELSTLADMEGTLDIPTFLRRQAD